MIARLVAREQHSLSEAVVVLKLKQSEEGFIFVKFATIKSNIVSDVSVIEVSIQGVTSHFFSLPPPPATFFML